MDLQKGAQRKKWEEEAEEVLKVGSGDQEPREGFVSVKVYKIKEYREKRGKKKQKKYQKQRVEIESQDRVLFLLKVYNQILIINKVYGLIAN